MRLRFATVALLLGALWGATASVGAYAAPPRAVAVSTSAAAASADAAGADESKPKPRKKTSRGGSLGLVEGLIIAALVILPLLVVLLVLRRARRAHRRD